jgi:acyl phosphate:glycerol-3-phosphate acyltransferase
MILSGFILLAFLWGSIPTGYLIVRLIKHEDIRKIGSGNIGATNVRRALGTRWFFITLLLDAFKGALPIFAASFIPDFSSFEKILIAALVMGGNLFCPWLGFKGGKGIGAGVGVVLALAPFPALASIVVFIIFLFALNYVSFASLMAAIIFPIAIFASNMIRGVRHDPLLLGFGAILACALILMHRANIARLINGTESKFFSRSK